jgi:pimeloyl-ACP methyl ester carboxylesterase
MRKCAQLAAILILMSAAGCGNDEKPVPPVPANAKAGQITAEPCTFTQFKKQTFAARCGVLYVPESRTKPNSRLITLPYVRILAQTKTPGTPVFALAGGPGQSNLSLGFPAGWFTGKRDVVLLGYRGVDGTVRLDCPEVYTKIRDGGSLLDRAGIARLTDAYGQCARRLQSDGVDLSGYTMLEVVDDLEEARLAFEYRSIDFLAISYGTRLALIYSWRYPQSVERSALVDVNPPGRFWLDPALLDAQIRRYAALCAKDSYCSARTKDLAGDMRVALKNMPSRWFGFPVKRDAVLFATFMGLYTTNSAASVFDMWTAAARGDYSGMALASAVFPMMLPNMAFGDAGAKATSADFEPGIVCNGLEPGKTAIGSPLNLMACAGMATWPVYRIPSEYRITQPSSTPMLMLGGTLDVATPFENARDQLLPAAPNAQQIVMAEAGHAGDLIYQQLTASERLITSFIDTGRGDASLYRYHPVCFDPGWMSLPLLAKVLFGALVVILALLAWLGWRITRRLRRS